MGVDNAVTAGARHTCPSATDPVDIDFLHTDRTVLHVVIDRYIWHKHATFTRDHFVYTEPYLNRFIHIKATLSRIKSALNFNLRENAKFLGSKVAENS